MMQLQTKHNEPEEPWEIVFRSRHLYQCEILKSVLADHDIPSVIINKQDSAYVMIGEIELYVKRPDVLRARQIVSTSLANE